MRFAPVADFRGLAEERKINRPWKRRIDRGYPEYGARMLEAAAPRAVSKSARRRMMSALDRARGRKVFHLTNKGIGLVKRRLRTAGRARRAGLLARPRSGRK